MILSHKNRFIFIRTRKVSDTSMEISLSQFCGEDNLDFDKELERILKKGYYVSYPIYSDGDTPIVDFIVSYENLQDDLAKLGDKLGFDVAAHYPQTKQTIYEHCRVEFEALGSVEEHPVHDSPSFLI